MAQPGTVTFLFTDLVDSVRHLQVVGDETGQRVFRAHHKLMTEALTANGGQELQWLGDGVLGIFAPSADAVCAAVSCDHRPRRGVDVRAVLIGG
jgi:class 3 adenylate cyclase